MKMGTGMVRRGPGGLVWKDGQFGGLILGCGELAFLSFFLSLIVPDVVMFIVMFARLRI